MTAYIVAQPFASLSLIKGTSRLAGTCVGGMAALLLTTLFVQWPLLHLTALALWLGLCIFLSLLEQSLFSSFKLVEAACSSRHYAIAASAALCVMALLNPLS